MKSTILMAMILSASLTDAVFAQQQRRSDQQRASEDSQFRSIFELPDVELTEDQEAELAELRRTYRPRLIENQRTRNQVFTAEQRRMRREALVAALEQGDTGPQARAAAESVLKLTTEQLGSIELLDREREMLVTDIRERIMQVLDGEQRGQFKNARVVERRQDEQDLSTTHANVKYGPHDRNVMDVWLAESSNPTPVLLSIHGGGFRGGNKSVDRRILRQCLESGISVVALTYRFSSDALAPASFVDSARALQFVRHHAEEWNIDPERIASSGGSAGAGISMWLAFHDDLADPEHEDPILRQSSRLTCAAVYNGQSSYDPRVIREMFPEFPVYQHSALAQLFGVSLDDLDSLSGDTYKLFEEVSALPHLTADDVPVLLFYASRDDTPINNHGVGIHHPRFGRTLEEAMAELDLECEVVTGISRNDEWADRTVEFVKRHFESH